MHKEKIDNLIQQQIRPWGGLNVRANDALASTPRDFFVPVEFKNMAFADMDIPLKENVFMLSPKIEGRILSTLDINENDKVLQIGIGSGYLTAVISKLAKTIECIEIDKDLLNIATEKLSSLAINNVVLKLADALKADFSGKKYDVVVITCALLNNANKFNDLLDVGGRLFAFIGQKNAMQARLIEKVSEDKINTTSIFETQVEYMKGEEPKKTFVF